MVYKKCDDREIAREKIIIMTILGCRKQICIIQPQFEIWLHRKKKVFCGHKLLLWGRGVDACKKAALVKLNFNKKFLFIVLNRPLIIVSLCYKFTNDIFSGNWYTNRLCGFGLLTAFCQRFYQLRSCIVVK